MQASDYNYAEVCNNTYDRGVVRDIPDIVDLYGAKPIECYTSIYRFTADAKAHVESTGSISGYEGPCRAIGLHFDFDSPHDDLALRETRQLFEMVCSNDTFGVNCDDISVWFSGNKGFHVLIANEETLGAEPCTDMPDRIKMICGAIASGFSAFDRRVYDRTRIFRVQNSKHMKSKLFKIPLYAEELWSLTMDDIRYLARHQRQLKNMDTIKDFLSRKGLSNGPV